jgi:hypothetical protein
MDLKPGVLLSVRRQRSFLPTTSHKADDWERLSDGRLFVFNSLQNWLSEFRIYRRDEKGKIVKQNDHLMDATRYLIMSGLQVACREPREEDDDTRQWIDSTRNEYTGY